MDAIAIQDANKIRIAMGLAPLPVPGEDAGLSFKRSGEDANDSDPTDNISTLEKRQAAAGDNWQRLQDEEKGRQDRLARKEAAKKARDAAARFAKLDGKGLGDAAEDEMDTKTWLLQQKKRQKQIDKARKMEAEQAAREQQAEYTSKDLAGLRVAHEMDKFDGGEEQILTLKDTEIGEDDEDDELENADMLATERLQERLELKKNKPVYDPNEVDETGERSILKHYDEEINGKKRKRFTLDEQGHSVPMEAPEDSQRASKGIKISLDILKDDTPVSDYAQASTTKIRKPKKNKAKTTRQKAVDEDDIIPIAAPVAPPAVDSSAMDVDGQPAGETSVPARRRLVELDDDDLQAQLAQQRRLALKKRKKTDAAELARRIREEASATPGPMDTIEGEDDDEEPGMIIDETTEFVANLQRPRDSEEREERKPVLGFKQESPDEEGDTTMAQAMNEVDEDELRQRMKRESATPAEEHTTSIFEAEETLNVGIGASLSMLRKRGLIQDGDGEAQNNKDRAREAFLAENRALIAEYDVKSRDQREKDRTSGRFDRMSAREREEYARRANEQREQYLASLQADHFKRSYRPDVKLKYTDEFGRDMNQKEAFKHLSHMFHGKGSGKQKTEKRLKKIEDEKMREAKSSLDASQHTGMNAMGATARKNRQAGVRLQ